MDFQNTIDRSNRSLETTYEPKTKRESIPSCGGRRRAVPKSSHNFGTSDPQQKTYDQPNRRPDPAELGADARSDPDPDDVSRTTRAVRVAFQTTLDRHDPTRCRDVPEREETSLLLLSRSRASSLSRLDTNQKKRRVHVLLLPNIRETARETLRQMLIPNDAGSDPIPLKSASRDMIFGDASVGGGSALQAEARRCRRPARRRRVDARHERHARDRGETRRRKKRHFAGRFFFLCVYEEYPREGMRIYRRRR